MKIAGPALWRYSVPMVILVLATCSSDVSQPRDSSVAAFDAWLTQARDVFARSGSGIDSLVYNHHCRNQEIGDRMATEPACTGFSILDAGDESLSVTVDWALRNPGRWHADVKITSPTRVRCREIQSSVEYERAKSRSAEMVACRTPTGGQVIVLIAPTDAVIAYLSEAFVRAYPEYVTAILSGI